MINMDYVNPVMLTGYVREIPGPAEYTLNLFLPDRQIGDIEAAWNQINKTNRAAQFRSYDASTSVGRRDQFSRSRVALPPLGQQSVVGEWERLQLERARSGGDSRGQIVQTIYDDAASNTLAVHARMEIARGDVLTDGVLTMNENGLITEADYGVPNDQLITVGTLWSDLDDSDPIEDMRTIVDAYTLRAGVAPAYGLTSRSVIGDLLRNPKIRALAASLIGSPQIITRGQLDAVLDAHELPRLYSYNTKIEDYDGNTVSPFPVDKIAFLPPDPRTLGETLWGITAEALELVGGQNPGLAFAQAPGLIGTVFKTDNPLRLWTNVGAVGMPVIYDNRRLWVAKVR